MNTLTQERDTFFIETGTLYVVSTPIGNLRDISLRALDVLEQVDLIAAEDTRASKVLLDAHNIQTPMLSHHDFNKEKVVPRLISQLQDDRSIAVISDAGTPGVSDPAFYLIREAIQHDIPVQAIPGATALIPALVLSGLPTDRFVFEGFLPTKKGRQRRLQSLAEDPRTLIFYESPYRVIRTLQDVYTHLGNRRVAIVRELTKKFETIVRGTLEQILAETAVLTLKGEFVIVIEGFTRKQQKALSKREEMSHEN